MTEICSSVFYFIFNDEASECLLFIDSDSDFGMGQQSEEKPQYNS